MVCRRRHRLHSFVYVCFVIIAMVIGVNMVLIKHEPTRALLSGIPMVGLALNDSVNPIVIIDGIEREVSAAHPNGNGSFTVDRRPGLARYHNSRDDSRYVHFTSSDFRYRLSRVAYVFSTNFLVVLITLYIAARQVRKNMAIGKTETGAR